MLHRDFKEFLKELDTHGAKYLLVGGYAVGHHGYPRYTSDVDVLVEPGEQNADKLVAAFADFGFPNTTSREDFLEPDRYLAIGQEPLRIHVLPSLTCNEYYITERAKGETLSRFHFAKNDLVLADRCYCCAGALARILRGGAEFLMRYRLKSMTLREGAGGELDLRQKLRSLRGKAVGEWPVAVQRTNDLLLEIMRPQKDRRGHAAGIEKNDEGCP